MPFDVLNFSYPMLIDSAIISAGLALVSYFQSDMKKQMGTVAGITILSASVLIILFKLAGPTLEVIL